MPLYIVATPIGNLEDITFRALRTLKEVDLILAEDTRQTSKLLNHYQINTPIISYHHHSRLEKTDLILNKLKNGDNIALVSDAGTPGISDPGNKLIEQITELLGNDAKIIPIPGPTAVTTLASVAGLPCDEFIFFGFLPHKKGRQTIIKTINQSTKTVILYESTYRIIKLLRELATVFNSTDLDRRRIVIGRELTKKFETIYRGNINQVANALENDKIKGEFTVIIGQSI
ncbi:MAG: 16S rRNA (cytidine(1402)-2'-O)-methyltransferase [Patescibacteria group bacterium]